MFNSYNSLKTFETQKVFLDSASKNTSILWRRSFTLSQKRTSSGSNLQVFARLFDDTPRAEQAPHLRWFAGSFPMDFRPNWLPFKKKKNTVYLGGWCYKPFTSPFPWPVKQIYHGIPSLSQPLGISIFLSDKPCPIELDCHWDCHQKRTVWRVSSSFGVKKSSDFSSGGRNLENEQFGPLILGTIFKGKISSKKTSIFRGRAVSYQGGLVVLSLVIQVFKSNWKDWCSHFGIRPLRHRKKLSLKNLYIKKITKGKNPSCWMESASIVIHGSLGCPGLTSGTTHRNPLLFPLCHWTIPGTHLGWQANEGVCYYAI